MRRLSRRLSERTRLNKKAIMLAVAACVSGSGMANAASLLEPGTTTYRVELASTDPLTVGRDHTLILDNENGLFVLGAPVVNLGTVQVTSPDPFWNSQFAAHGAQVNQGRWILNDNMDAFFDDAGDFDNRAGTFEIGQDSVATIAMTFYGGSIHGTSGTSRFVAQHLRDVTMSGQVRLTSSSPWLDIVATEVSGTLTVTGTLHSEGIRLGANTVLKGGGQTVLSGGAVSTTPEASGAQLTIASGHTLTGHSQLSNITLINQGTLNVEQGRSIVGNAVVVQQETEAITQVSGGLAAAEIRLQGGVIDVRGVLSGLVTVDGGMLVMHEGGSVKGDVDVRSGRVSVYASSADALASWEKPAFEGNLMLSDNAEFEVIVSSGIDALTLGTTGLTWLGGKLILTFAEGVRPVSPEFLLVFDTYIQGTFKSLEVRGAGNLPWHIAEQSGPFVVLSSVPEPETWGLMLCGLGVVGWRLRRRAPAQTTH